MLNYILFTHDDMDGYGGKIVFDLWAIHKGETNYEVVICGNSNVDSIVMEYFDSISNKIGPSTNVYFSDIVPSEPVLGMVKFRLDTNAIRSVVICDHHDTNMYAKDIIQGATICPKNEVGTMESGTSLLYKNLFESTSTPGFDEELFGDLVDAIRSYDTYEWKQTNNIIAKKLNILFTMIGGENFCNRYIERIQHPQIACIKVGREPGLISKTDLEFVDCKYNFEQSVIDNVTTDDIIDVNIKGHRCALMVKSVSANISELSYQFLEKHPEFDAFIQFSLFKGGTFSFRNIRDDIHMGTEFAEPLGGGGHPRAAGASAPDMIKDALKDSIIRFLNGEDFSIAVYNNEHKGD